MLSWRHGTVVELLASWSATRELTVEVEGIGLVPALAFTPLVGFPRVGDAVLLNMTAYDLALGTGGYALVVAMPDNLPADRTEPGHLVKARYTPMQAVVLGVDEQESTHHLAMARDEPLPGTPVVVADLHSSLPAIVVGVHAAEPAARVAYVMTDGAALPLWLSRTVAGLGTQLCGSVTVGQAYGGTLEAVTLHSGLLAAVRVLEADVVIVTQGPGNLGTGTTWGFSGIAAGEAVNATVAVGGRAVAVLRASECDPRPRHRGISHHSMTAYGRVALAPADLVLPSSYAELLGPLLGDLVHRHRVVEIDDSGLLAALRRSVVPLSTMGRGLEDDPVAFVTAAAAGRHAASLLGWRPTD